MEPWFISLSLHYPHANDFGTVVSENFFLCVCMLMWVFRCSWSKSLERLVNLTPTNPWGGSTTTTTMPMASNHKTNSQPTFLLSTQWEWTRFLLVILFRCPVKWRRLLRHVQLASYVVPLWALPIPTNTFNHCIILGIVSFVNICNSRRFPF